MRKKANLFPRLRLSTFIAVLAISFLAYPAVARADVPVALLISGGFPAFVPHASGEQTAFGQPQPVYFVANNAVLPGQVGTAITRIWFFPPQPNTAAPNFGPYAGVIVFRFSLPGLNDLIVFATAFQTSTGQVLSSVASALPTDQVGAESELNGSWGFASATSLGVAGAGPSDVVIGMLLRDWTVSNVDPNDSLSNWVLNPLFGPGNVVSSDYGGGRSAEHRYFQVLNVENHTVDGYAGADALWHRSTVQTSGLAPVTNTVDLAMLYFKSLKLYLAVPCLGAPDVGLCRFSATYPGLSFLGPVAVRTDGPNEDVTFGLGPGDWILSGFLEIALPPKNAQ
jgi:hypothetical protein